MATLSELQQQLDRLREIRAKGVRELEISSGDMHRRLVYSSGEEIDAAIRAVQDQIDRASGSRVSSVVFCTSKGI